MENKILDKPSENNFIKQGTILAAASIVSRIIGMLYRSPMANIIGDDGNGLYSIAFEIYSIALILSSYSMPLAVSKLLSAKFAKREYKNGYRIFKFSMVFSFISGLTMSLIIFFGAGLIEKISGYPGVAIPLRILAPTIFVVAIVGTLRGFFQSRKTMLPTAVSQLADQIINAIISIVASIIFVKIWGGTTKKASWGAAGGTMGTLFGALSSLFFLAFLFVIYRPRLHKHLGHDTTGYTDSPQEIIKMLFYTIIPVILSQFVYQSVGIIDGFLFGNLYKDASRLSLYGIYSGKYRLMVNIPNSISSALASSMIPTLVSLYTLGKKREFKNKLATSVKFNMIIAFPCAVGLTVLAYQIMWLLFPTTDIKIASRLLTVGSIAVIFYALSTITNAALQGIDHMRLPVRHAAIALVIHIIFVVLMLKFTNLNVYALVIGNVIYPLVVCALNWYSVGKYAHYHQEVKSSFLIPAAASAIMGIITFAFSRLLAFILPSRYICNFINVFLSMIIAVLVYFVAIFLLKGLTAKDMPDFPMGMRIARVARKFHLMK